MPTGEGDAGFRELLERIGANVHRLRREAGITQETLAEDLDVAVEHLRGVEGGYRTPSIQLLWRAANRFGVDPADFFCSAKAPERNPGRPRRR